MISLSPPQDLVSPAAYLPLCNRQLTLTVAIDRIPTDTVALLQALTLLRRLVF
ncbi:hypothetical protein Hanom_Chr03g00238031 [Helianthus anomalus]